MRIFQYLWYILKHKYYVFYYGLEFYPYCSIWQLLVHDLSKFLPSEFFPYLNWFYKKEQTVPFSKFLDRKDRFNAAWLKHIHRNPHHWQYWILQQDNGKFLALQIPPRYLFEMLVDWMAMAKTFGNPSVSWWYEKNRMNIQLHDETRKQVESYFKIIEKPAHDNI